MSRANSLKKAVRQIIEHTEKGTQFLPISSFPHLSGEVLNMLDNSYVLSLPVWVDVCRFVCIWF